MDSTQFKSFQIDTISLNASCFLLNYFNFKFLIDKLNSKIPCEIFYPHHMPVEFLLGHIR